MARKNPFASVMDETPSTLTDRVPEYPMRGASKSILSSINEIASQADKLREGTTVVELEPELIDGSFVTDRMSGDEAEFAELLEAIRARGQDTPILVRPHPNSAGRYMVVYGHRRLRAAKELGRTVVAVVKELNDQDHIVAQGQENSARANLSFIERAVFAHKLARLRYDNDNALVTSALSIDRATLSKMLSVAAIPAEVLDAVGAAKSIGRDRWYELKTNLEKPANLEAALRFVAQSEFADLSTDERFNRLLQHLKTLGKPNKSSKIAKRRWAPEDNKVAIDLSSDGRNYTLALKAKDAVGFGEFISENLDELYEAYRQRNSAKQGD